MYSTMKQRPLSRTQPPKSSGGACVNAQGEGPIQSYIATVITNSNAVDLNFMEHLPFFEFYVDGKEQIFSQSSLGYS
jgi:hypothetical protein